MRQLQMFTTAELAAMRDRTASRRYSPAGTHSGALISVTGIGAWLAGTPSACGAHAATRVVAGRRAPARARRSIRLRRRFAHCRRRSRHRRHRSRHRRHRSGHRARRHTQSRQPAETHRDTAERSRGTRIRLQHTSRGPHPSIRSPRPGAANRRRHQHRSSPPLQRRPQHGPPHPRHHQAPRRQDARCRWGRRRPAPAQPAPTPPPAARPGLPQPGKAADQYRRRRERFRLPRRDILNDIGAPSRSPRRERTDSFTAQSKAARTGTGDPLRSGRGHFLATALIHSEEPFVDSLDKCIRITKLAFRHPGSEDGAGHATGRRRASSGGQGHQPCPSPPAGIRRCPQPPCAGPSGDDSATRRWPHLAGARPSGVGRSRPTPGHQATTAARPDGGRTARD